MKKSVIMLKPDDRFYVYQLMVGLEGIRPTADFRGFPDRPDEMRREILQLILKRKER